MVDVERIEVLRGPQGTLYGRNTTGGAVSLYTKDPDDKLGGSIQVSAGNYDMWDVLGVLNLPLAEGVGLRLVVAHAWCYFHPRSDSQPMASSF
jgi:iron complex outermembrane recepter protein